MLTIKEADDALKEFIETREDMVGKLVWPNSEVVRLAKAMCDLMQAVEDGKVAVVLVKPTKNMCFAGVEVSVSPTIPAEVYKAMVKAADCELAKILEDV